MSIFLDGSMNPIPAMEQNDTGPTLDPNNPAFIGEDTPAMAMNNNRPPDITAQVVPGSEKSKTQIALDRLRESGYVGVTGFQQNKNGTWTITIQKPKSTSATEQGIQDAFGQTFGGTKTDNKPTYGSDEQVLLDFGLQASLEPFLLEALKERGIASGSGSAVSYVQSETDKQQEVSRQFKDFLARAQGVYDLMDSEQQRAMRADDQNAQNMKAAREGLIAYPGDYGVGSMETAYSRILAPSVPNYVLPDYRLGGAVGLPGGVEGYDNPNYTSTGVPITPATTPTTTPSTAPAITTSASKQPVSYLPDGTAVYGYNDDGTPITEPPPGLMLAMGTDYKAMLMRKLITGGRYA